MRSNALSWCPTLPTVMLLASEDHNLYTFDIRMLESPTQVYKGHVGGVMGCDWSEQRFYGLKRLTLQARLVKASYPVHTIGPFAYGIVMPASLAISTTRNGCSGKYNMLAFALFLTAQRIRCGLYPDSGLCS